MSVEQEPMNIPRQNLSIFIFYGRFSNFYWFFNVRSFFKHIKLSLISKAFIATLFFCHLLNQMLSLKVTIYKLRFKLRDFLSINSLSHSLSPSDAEWLVAGVDKALLICSQRFN